VLRLIKILRIREAHASCSKLCCFISKPSKSKVRTGRRIRQVHIDRSLGRITELMNNYNSDRYSIFAAHKVKVRENKEYEIIVWSDETSPCRYVLNKNKFTKVASKSISTLWVFTGCDWSLSISLDIAFGNDKLYII
jgi:hypothetical protein